MLCCKTNRDLFEMYNQIPVGKKNGLWKSVSRILQCSDTEAHDYFFNTWLSQFYENSILYKD